MTTPAPVYGPPPTASTLRPATGYRRPLPALVAAVAVAAGWMLLEIVQVAISSIYNEVNSRFSQGFAGLWTIAVESLKVDVPTLVVVVVLGFVFFWGIAPIHAELRIGQVINRSIWCAVAVGVVLIGVFSIQYLIIVSSPAIAQYGGPSLHDLLRNTAEAVTQAVYYFARTIAFIILGAVLLWNWTRTHPRPSAAS